MGEDAEGIRRRWAAWAADVMGQDEAAAADVARAAIRAVEAGAGDAVAAVFGRMARLPPTEADVAMLDQELRRVRRTRLGLTSQALSESELERRRAYLARLDGLLASALVQARHHLQPERPSPARLHTALHVAVGAVLVIAALLLAAFHVGVGASLGVACLALAHAVYSRRWGLSWAPALCVGVALVTIARWFALGSTAIGIELVTLAAVLTCIAAIAPAGRAALWPTTAALLLVVATLLPDELWAHVAMLAGATALAGLMAMQARRPPWLLLAMLLGTVAMYWAARLWLPGTGPDPVAIAATALWPVPLAVAAAGVVARDVAGRRWAVPAYGFAAALAIAHLAAAGVSEPNVLAWTAALAVYAGAGYAIAARERWTAAAVPCVVALSIAPLGAVAALHLDVVLLPVAYSALAVVVTMGQLAGRGARLWRELHAAAGFAIAGCTALVCLASPSFWHGWTAAPLLAIVPIATVSALLLFESRIPPSRFLWYPATLVFSMSTLWVARFVDVTNPEWYVLGPSITIACLAVRATRDPILPSHPLGVCRACAAFGCVAPLAVTLWLSLDGDAGLYSLLLLVQGAVCLGAGVRFGNRALIVCGLLGSGATVLRALGFLGLLLPPAAAAVVAALLLALAGLTIVLARRSLGDAWARLARTWQRGI